MQKIKGEESVLLYANILKNGGIGVVPTDTVYGISASVFFEQAVEKIYQIKKRNQNKPLIILISNLNDLREFEVDFSEKICAAVKKYWPGKVSLILPCSSKKFFYLKRNKQSLAFRCPDKADLLNLIKLAGPLVSTSVNPEGLSPAKNIYEAKKYFGNEIDFYWNGGNLIAKPSKIIDLTGETEEIIRS